LSYQMSSEEDEIYICIYSSPDLMQFRNKGLYYLLSPAFGGEVRVRGKMAKEYARSLRRHMTDAERLLWKQLRNRQMDGWKFRRQHPLGPFTVDFICLEKKIIVEVDGGQHAIQIKEDAERSRFLQEKGYRILRFWNTDVLKGIDSVLEVIYRELSGDPPHLTSPPRGRGK
jgi:very-short-patch-repair endonuclease